ncbi:hypothetical protein AKO1_013324 [Acrasis kona]|uniref:Uncharacterized protein n=1 Tax=Acrasis kona TaxID=1008807 RepID=A0AAW2YYL7_9EUKA
MLRKFSGRLCLRFVTPKRFAHVHKHDHTCGSGCNHTHHTVEEPQPRPIKEFDLNNIKKSISEHAGQDIPLSEIPEEEINLAFSEVVTGVNKHNREQFIYSTWIQDEDLRLFYLTLIYLNGELLRIKEKVRTPGSGEIRFAWWKANLKSSMGGIPPKVPVLIALSYFSKKYNLTYHELEFKWTQPPDMQAIEGYGEGIYSSILYMMLDAINYRTTHSAHVASHIGKCYGISLLLRGTAYHAEKNRTTFLPASVCAKYGVTEEDIYKKQYTKSIGDAVFEVADQAKAHLDAARDHAKSIIDPPTDYKRVLQIATFCDLFLYRLQKVQVPSKLQSNKEQQ